MILMREVTDVRPAVSFTPSFIAKENGTSVPTITRACQNGLISARKVGKQWRISREERAYSARRILRNEFAHIFYQVLRWVCRRINNSGEITLFPDCGGFRALVRGQVIEDDNITMVQRRRELGSSHGPIISHSPGHSPEMCHLIA